VNETKFTIDKEKLTVTIERVFNAPRDLVWKVTTDPELIAKWWGPESSPVTVDAMDVRVGGTWRFVGNDPQGGEYGFSGKYLEIEAPHRLVQTWNFEPIGPDHETVETAVLEELDDDRTKMTTTAVYQSIEDLEGNINSGMESGARETWERLASLVDSLNN
jgi:uncharacterized protein YndB with AHSA1/START domain